METVKAERAMEKLKVGGSMEEKQRGLPDPSYPVFPKAFSTPRPEEGSGALAEGESGGKTEE